MRGDWLLTALSVVALVAVAVAVAKAVEFGTEATAELADRADPS